MNITHAKNEIVTGCKLQAIFDRQKELMNKYHDIELKSGLMQTEECPVLINDKRGQARLKDFAWRFTEELAEALDSKFVTKDGKEHYQEELIDSLHFLAELTILSGITPDDLAKIIYTTEEDVYTKDRLDLLFKRAIEVHIDRGLTEGYRKTKELAMDIIMEVGMACNCLKNKPWKQSQMLTDEKAFRGRINKTWINFLILLNKAGLDPDSICEIYLKKSQVNQFRQRSNY